MAIKQHIPISLKRQCARALNRVENGTLSRDKAEELLKKRLDYSPMLRDDLVESLTMNYEKGTAETLRFFGMI